MQSWAHGAVALQKPCVRKTTGVRAPTHWLPSPRPNPAGTSVGETGLPPLSERFFDICHHGIEEGLHVTPHNLSNMSNGKEG